MQERGADLCLAAVALDLTVGAAHALVAENVSAVICLDLAVCAADAAVAEDIAALVAGDLVVGVAVALVAEEVGALVGLDLAVHTADALVAEDGLAAVAGLLEVAVIILFHGACPFVVYALRTVRSVCLPEQTVSGFVIAAACACPAGDSGSKEHLAPEYLHDTASGSLRRNFRVPLSCAVQERGRICVKRILSRTSRSCRLC